MNDRAFVALRIGLILFGLGPSGCAPAPKPPTVVIYTSVDQVYSEPILREFEQKTGIRVLSVFDVEAAKTTGLVNRLMAEKDRPQADVFWNGEFVHTLALQHRGVLAPYLSPQANDIPRGYRDPEGYWTGIAGRARVLIVNTNRVRGSKFPSSLLDLVRPDWPADQIGIAYPLFGTTATHAAALYAALGPARAKALFVQVRARGVRIVDGNSVVRDMVADGRLMFGFTDTDDAYGAVKRGAPVQIVFPDQQIMGTLVIPNTVALIANSPNPEAGKALIDFLVSRDVEGKLIASGWSHVPLHPGNVNPIGPDTGPIKNMNVNFEQIFEQIERSQRELRDIFVR